MKKCILQPKSEPSVDHCLNSCIKCTGMLERMVNRSEQERNITKMSVDDLERTENITLSTMVLPTTPLTNTAARNITVATAHHCCSHFASVSSTVDIASSSTCSFDTFTSIIDNVYVSSCCCLYIQLYSQYTHIPFSMTSLS